MANVWCMLATIIGLFEMQGTDGFCPPREAKAYAVLTRANEGSTPGVVIGMIQFTEVGQEVKVVGNITGLTPGLHGFHVHQVGDISNRCLAAGPHYNPDGHTHGAPLDQVRHVGDLGNINAGMDGVAHISIIDDRITLRGRKSIVGHDLVVHDGVDDLGKGNNDESKTTGNAGGRFGCGVIQFDI